MNGLSVKPKIPSEIELKDRGLRLVSVTFGITLCSNSFFSDIPKEVLGSFRMFLELCPAENLRFYATTNMRQHKPVTNRVRSMLETWLKPGAPRPDLMDLELKDGEAYQDAPKFKFAICAGEKGSLRHAAQHSNILSMAFPAEWGLQRTAEMLTLVKQMTAAFPFVSGDAGFSLECSRYAKSASETHAWIQSMRHRGANIVRLPADGKAVGQDAVKSVNWLTMIGMPLVERLGGLERLRKALSTEVDVMEVAAGIVIRAGSVPAFGDWAQNEHLPLYRDVHRALSPVIETAAKRSMAFSLVEDFVERTEAWYRRHEDE